MPRTSRSRLLRRTSKRQLFPIYTAVLLLVFHTFVVAYVNSSFLEQYIDSDNVGIMYTIGSALSVLLFLFISRVLQRVGNFTLTLTLLASNFLAVSGMAFASSLQVALPLFLIHIISVPLIIFNLDIFLEERIGNDESGTGSSRGLLLTLSSLIGACSPLISGLLIGTADTPSFTTAYIVSAATLIPITAILLFYFKSFRDPTYGEVDLFAAIHTFWEKQNLRNVFIAHFLLQMFFMMMVVYTPLYLTGTMQLTWTQFGIVMFFAQLAYVLLEYPIGILADKYIGEKEMMLLGFLIIIAATASMTFITATSVIAWAIIMFISRVGAALVEVTTESFFFKQTKSSDAQIISFFRVTRPLSYVIGALLGSGALLFLSLDWIFVVFATLLIPAVFCVLSIRDTR